MTVATRITVPLLSNDNIRDAARHLEWLVRDLRLIHNLREPTSRKVLMAQLRVRHAHKTLMAAAVGDTAKQNFKGAT